MIKVLGYRTTAEVQDNCSSALKGMNELITLFLFSELEKKDEEKMMTKMEQTMLK